AHSNKGGAAAGKEGFRLVIGTAELNRETNDFLSPEAETPSFLSSLVPMNPPPPKLPPEPADELPPDAKGFVLVEANDQARKAVQTGRNTIFTRKDDTSNVAASVGDSDFYEAGKRIRGEFRTGSGPIDERLDENCDL